MQISFPGDYPEPSHGKLIFVKPNTPPSRMPNTNFTMVIFIPKAGRATENTTADEICCSLNKLFTLLCAGDGGAASDWGEEGSPAHCLLPNPARWNVETPHSENKQVAKSCVHGPAQPVVHTQLKNQMSRCQGRSLSNCTPAPVGPRTESHSWRGRR